ncbi:Rieske (2Fe-2S) protein [Actinocorallia longicatena]|uniref:Cytochrome bc1 complex Rieske iron-sulfur subunit n=1 Tax=Actinocorallia longicatena TaxID=111803 RepID=A0ABP6Q1C4_9ACTN
METERRAVLAAGVVGAVGAASGCAVYGKKTAATAETVLGKVADVPVGGSKIFTKEKVIVSQPTAGTFTALSAICTHQGCPVDKIEGTKVTCPCHGSAFNLADGSVARSPATAPLAPAKVKVSGEDLILLPD